MTEVVAVTERVVHAPAEQVRAALADYEGFRSRIAGPQFSEYRVETGGRGAGTRVHWKFAATAKRVRDQLVDVGEPGDGSLVERDANSSMITTWTVQPAAEGSVTVRVRTTWNGAGGVGGFFERTFAPRGLQRTYDGILERLDAELARN